MSQRLSAVRNRTRILVLVGLISLVIVGLFSTAAPLSAKPASTRYYPPPSWILGPMVGWIGQENSIDNILDGFALRNIPLTAFHFDWFYWQTCPGSAQWRFSNALLRRLKNNNIRALFWYVPMVDQSCPDYASAAAAHYFVEGTDGKPIVTNDFTGNGSWVDFNNPAAVSWLHGKWDALLAQTMVNGVQVTGGFYVDNVRPDLPNQTGDSYAEAFARDLLDYTRAHIPDGDVVLKHYGQNTDSTDFLTQYGHTAYVNDDPTDFAGMTTGIKDVLKLANILPAPFNEFTGNWESIPDSETYIRRLHWGAMQAVMDESPAEADFPWQNGYTPQVQSSYQYYATLHWELVPYLNSLDQAAYENNTSILLSPNLKNPSVQLGDELFASFVTAYTSHVSFALPAGTWVNFWNETQTQAGPAQVDQKVPLGKEPIWIKNGAIIPLQVRDDTTGDGNGVSASSVTVRVYPNKASSFRYYDPAKTWVTFQSLSARNTLTLCTTGTVPSQPVIYKIARQNKKPKSVTTDNGALGVNQTWGTAVPKLKNARAVQGSSGGWFYDAPNNTLWVKLTQLGTNCPTG